MVYQNRKAESLVEGHGTSKRRGLVGSLPIIEGLPLQGMVGPQSLPLLSHFLTMPSMGFLAMGPKAIETLDHGLRLLTL
jgi:hypothetical protein